MGYLAMGRFLKITSKMFSTSLDLIRLRVLLYYRFLRKLVYIWFLLNIL